MIGFQVTDSFQLWISKIESRFSLRSVRELKSLIGCSGLYFGLPIDFLGPKGLGLVIRTRYPGTWSALEASKPKSGSPR